MITKWILIAPLLGAFACSSPPSDPGPTRSTHEALAAGNCPECNATCNFPGSTGPYDPHDCFECLNACGPGGDSTAHTAQQ